MHLRSVAMYDSLQRCEFRAPQMRGRSEAAMMDAALPAHNQSKRRMTKPPISENMSTTTSGHCSRLLSIMPVLTLKLDPRKMFLDSKSVNGFSKLGERRMAVLKIPRWNQKVEQSGVRLMNLERRRAMQEDSRRV